MSRCTKCHSKAATGVSVCPKHRKAHRRYDRLYRERMRYQQAKAKRSAVMATVREQWPELRDLNIRCVMEGWTLERWERACKELVRRLG